MMIWVQRYEEVRRIPSFFEKKESVFDYFYYLCIIASSRMHVTASSN